MHSCYQDMARASPGEATQGALRIRGEEGIPMAGRSHEGPPSVSPTSAAHQQCPGTGPLLSCSTTHSAPIPNVPTCRQQRFHRYCPLWSISDFLRTLWNSSFKAPKPTSWLATPESALKISTCGVHLVPNLICA